MTKRCIYFVKDNQLYRKTVEVEWDKDNLNESVKVCNNVIKDNILPFMIPCANVSSSSMNYISRNMATCFVKDTLGRTVKSLWGKLDKSLKAECIPPGAHDLLYILSLDENQVMYALSHESFYDSFHNPDNQPTCSAKALASLKLLYMQKKVDYVEDMNKFLWWYWVNCQFAFEYINKDRK